MSKSERINGTAFVLLGPPGAGKSTQGLHLSLAIEGNFLSTGDLLREEVNSPSTLGQQIESIINDGGTVSTNLLLPVLEKAAAKMSPGDTAILDFAGTGDQCTVLDEMLARYGRAVFASLLLEVPPSESRVRLIARGRVDDKIEMIDKRLAVYQSETVLTGEYYRERGLLHAIDGCGTPEEVTERLLARIRSLRNELSSA